MKKTLMMALMFLMVFVLTGCGSFFGEDETLLIEKIEYQHLEDEGVTRVTVTYLNEDKRPDVFDIPDGIQGAEGPIGKDGNGIKTIEYKYSADGFTTQIKVLYTDDELEPTVFEIPNGRSVSGVRSETDRATGNTLMYVQYSDGTEEKEPIIIRKGVDGNSIIGYNTEVKEDKSVVITFQCSQSDDVVINIPAPEKGDQGVGIDSMISSESETEYFIFVKLTDGTEQKLNFSKPTQPSTWLTGVDVPRNNEGKVGDYYFDSTHSSIYYKSIDGWDIVVDLNGTVEMFNITFNLNDNDGGPKAYMPQNAFYNYKLQYGQCIGTSVYKVVPIPTRVGYTFKGWYLTPVVSPVNGTFTDLTPVFCDMELYACWELNE